MFGCSSPGGAGGSGPPISGNLGGVTANNSIDMTGQPNQSFGSLLAAFGTASCTGTKAGACVLVTCAAAPQDMGQPNPPAAPNAGTIALAGGSQPLSLAPGTDGSYAFASEQGMPLWNGGETLKVSGTGGTVGAFNAQVTAPAPASVSAPVVTSGPFPATTAPLTSDLTVTWTGGTGTLNFQIGSTGSANQNIQCYFPASAGTGAVPSSLLQMIGAGTAGASAMTIGQTVVGDGDWQVVVTAGAAATRAGDGTVYTGNLVLQ